MKRRFPDTPVSDPVLGALAPDSVAQILGTGYMRFEAPSGIHGLAKRDGTRLDVLAVLATKPRSGQFKRFIRECQDYYETVCVWEDWNPIVGRTLERFGFSPEIEIQYNEPVRGWRWDKKA